MTSYTITVAPSDSSSTTTTVTVETSGRDVRITDVHLHSAGGLNATRLPSIDINLLMQAVSPHHDLAQTSSHPGLAAADHQAQTPDVTDDASSATSADDSDSPVLEEVSVQAESAKPPRGTGARGRRRGSATEPAVATTSEATSSRTRRRTQSAETAPTKATSTRKKRAAQEKNPAQGQARVYRRTPDDFSAVAQELNSATAIAEHYQVPRHTAQHWLRRLRAAEVG